MEAEIRRKRKVFDILAEEVDVVAEFLVGRILASKRKYDRIKYLNFGRMLPKLVKLMFIKHQISDHA